MYRHITFGMVFNRADNVCVSGWGCEHCVKYLHHYDGHASLCPSYGRANFPLRSTNQTRDCATRCVPTARVSTARTDGGHIAAAPARGARFCPPYELLRFAPPVR